MATILLTRVVSDGVDYDCELIDGRQVTFHSEGGAPADPQEWVDACEAGYPPAEVS